QRLNLDVDVVLQVRVFDRERGPDGVRRGIDPDPRALDIGILDVAVIGRVVVEAHTEGGQGSERRGVGTSHEMVKDHVAGLVGPQAVGGEVPHGEVLDRVDVVANNRAATGRADPPVAQAGSYGEGQVAGEVENRQAVHRLRLV